MSEFPVIATPANTNRITAVIDSVYVRPSGGLYQTLGGIRGGELVIEAYTQKDGNKKNKTFGSRSVTAKVTMMQCSLTEIELMDTLIDGTNSFLFKLADAGAIPSVAAVTAGWMVFTSTQIGVKPKIVLSGDAETPCEIQLEFAGSLQNAAVDAAVKASIDDNEFEATGGSGTFKAIGLYTATLDGGKPDVTHQKSGGISALTIADTSGSTPQTLGPVDSPTIEFEYIAEQDSLKVFRSRWVNINFEYQWKQTDSANLLNLDAFSDSEVNVTTTMANGIIITLTNQVGIADRFESLGDTENTRSIVFKHEGSVLPSAIDGIFSV